MTHNPPRHCYHYGILSVMQVIIFPFSKWRSQFHVSPFFKTALSTHEHQVTIFSPVTGLSYRPCRNPESERLICSSPDSNQSICVAHPLRQLCVRIEQGQILHVQPQEVRRGIRSFLNINKSSTISTRHVLRITAEKTMRWINRGSYTICAFDSLLLR